MTDKPISEMTTDELLALSESIDNELFGVGSQWIKNSNGRWHTVTANRSNSVDFEYTNTWSKLIRGVSNKQTLLETFTKAKDIKNG